MKKLILCLCCLGSMAISSAVFAKTEEANCPGCEQTIRPDDDDTDNSNDYSHTGHNNGNDHGSTGTSSTTHAGGGNSDSTADTDTETTDTTAESYHDSFESNLEHCTSTGYDSGKSCLEYANCMATGESDGRLSRGEEEICADTLCENFYDATVDAAGTNSTKYSQCMQEFYYCNPLYSSCVPLAVRTHGATEIELSHLMKK